MSRCEACSKVYSTPSNLNKHLKRQPLCQSWIDLQSSGIKGYIDEAIKEQPQQEDKAPQCPSCKLPFANIGNMNRHLESSIVCKKWSMFQQISPIVSYMSLTKESHYDTFVTPKYSLCHIIWNVFLVDKEFTAKMDMTSVCKENKIKYIIAILPSAQQIPVLNVNHRVMIYEGHDTVLDIVAFDEECLKIERYREARDNVMVFCNSGYQRSIPFLCYYLLKYHRKEVPDVPKAIDIILPQVDKKNYNTLRPKYVENITRLLTPYI